jgi:hypothetical protein
MIYKEIKVVHPRKLWDLSKYNKNFDFYKINVGDEIKIRFKSPNKDILTFKIKEIIKIDPDTGIVDSNAEGRFFEIGNGRGYNNMQLEYFNNLWKDEINELGIKQKKKIGSGAYKDVYDLETHPNLIVKKFDVLDKDVVKDVEEEEQLSKKYPELFTKIEKVIYNKGIIIQEKVDPFEFRNDIDKLKTEIVNITPSFKPTDISFYLFRHIRDKNKEAIVIIKDILQDNKNKLFYNKLITYLTKLCNINKNIIDVHRENFGYNNDKQIKMFDI